MQGLDAMMSPGAMGAAGPTAEELDAEEEEAVAAALMLRRAAARRRRAAAAGAPGRRRRAMYRGSVPGRRPNKKRDFNLGLRSIMRDYFGVDGKDPVYDEADFERRFRVPRTVFMRIFDAIKDQPSFRQRINATGRPQAHPLQKVVAAFRVIAYGEAYDRTDEYVRLSRSTIAVATKKLMSFIVRRFTPEYLRQPTKEELLAILKRNAERGLPGCIGSIDCSHWRWTACPKGFQGMYQSGADKGNRSIVLEAACDEDLWIWHWYVGAPGSFNDVNVFHESPLYLAITSGQWPPSLPYTINGRTRDIPYYLADGIYPRYAFLVTPYPQPVRTMQSRTFNRLQEAVRKDVERLYGVLTARFHIALHPARYRTVQQLTTTAKAIAILHNMTVEVRREQFTGRRRSAAAAAAAQGAAQGAPAAADGAAIDEAAPPGQDLDSGNGASAESGAGNPAPAAGAAVDEAAPGNAGAAPPESTADEAARGTGGVPLPALPHPLPVIEAAEEAIEGTLCQGLIAWARTTDTGEHLSLRNDLAEHVWADRGDLLMPYVHQ